ncbi:hypothetical protein CesoFtcFv8_000283 [Champsocephalus esox]|uniref:ZP domain-containing protein n=1 Tax=Champsocephalus esox TaxID=159716 RepID=A0AAN8E1Y1_9TELE|nr:hypothetical protein CesoFtcFv8_000283 [Champsocephalus esox]
MRLSLDKALAVGNQLEVEAINGTKHILLTPSMAARCGYSMESDPWGNTRIYTSLMGCFVDNKDDATFNVGLRLQMYGENPSDVVAGVPMEVFRVSAYYMAPQGLNVVNLAAACPKDTVPETRVFSVLLGTFLHDVELRNITFSTGVLTVGESNAKGFTVQEHSLANGSKSFSLQVPFDADVVLKHNPERLVTSYFLPLIFGLVVLPEETPFGLPVDLQASLQDIVLPIMAGTCDQNHFHISVKFGSHGSNFKAIVGPRELTAEMAEDYNFYENGTHLSLSLPYTAKDAVFELLTAESVRSRIDLLLLDRANDWVLADLYLACYFPLKATECHPNGTMTAVAVKVESTRNLKPSQLTLKDQSCTPQFSDDRGAYFSFSVDTCGTTRTFFDNYMMYENEIRLSYNNAKAAANTSPVDPDYRTSLPSWDIIVDSCENRNDSYATIFHPVVSDSRVLVPSHIKRFSVKMFTFTKDDEVLKDKIYVHCDAVICDTSSQADGSCRGQCVHPPGQSYSRPAGVKKERRSTDSPRQRQISSGAIILSDL